MVWTYRSPDESEPTFPNKSTKATIGVETLSATSSLASLIFEVVMMYVYHLYHELPKSVDLYTNAVSVLP